MKKTIFCPRSSCQHRAVINIDETPRVTGCDKCGQPQSVFVVRGSRLLRLSPIAFLFPTPLDGPWERVCWWPAEQEVLDAGSARSFKDQTAEPNTCWIYKDGKIEESITFQRVSEIMLERFGGAKAGAPGSKSARDKTDASTKKASSTQSDPNKPWWRFW